jgi:quercetin dioxygenase-like cupin family protein
MSLTFIDTNKLPKVKTQQGEATEVLSEKLVGAKNVLATLRWLKSGEELDAKPAGKHQLIYLVEGEGRISLNGKDYSVRKGAGVYLEPNESAKISADKGTLKLFHLLVPRIPV